MIEWIVAGFIASQSGSCVTRCFRAGAGPDVPLPEVSL
jgi:hypothetical protein